MSEIKSLSTKFKAIMTFLGINIISTKICRYRNVISISFPETVVKIQQNIHISKTHSLIVCTTSNWMYF